MSGPDQKNAPDLILYNGNVITLDQNCRHATGVTVSNGLFVFVGDSADALAMRSKNARIVDLEGKTLVPGFVDCHGHLQGLGKQRAHLDLTGVRSQEEMLLKTGTYMAGKKPGDWILGRGWDHTEFSEPVFPDKTNLDSISPHNPVFLVRVDGHAVLVNSLALSAAGVDEHTSDPSGGRICRFPDSSMPTGILLDNAMFLVQNHIPAATGNEIENYLLDATRVCMRCGLTGVHDAGITIETWHALKQLVYAGKWKLPVYAMIWALPEDIISLLDNIKPEYKVGGLLDAAAVKIFVDGSLGSSTAALLEPYSDDPRNDGIVTTTEKELKLITEKSLKKGFQPCFHAIGDRAVKIVLDALEDLGKKYDLKQYRPRIEHAQIIHPDHIRRMAKMNVIASIQPGHLLSDMKWIRVRLGKNRMNRAFPWKNLRDANVPISFGSDFPIDCFNPFHVLHAAVNGCGREGDMLAAWNSENLFTVDDALKAYTIGAACASFNEATTGTITPGKRADFVVLPENPLLMERNDLHSLTPAAVYIAGEKI